MSSIPFGDYEIFLRASIPLRIIKTKGDLPVIESH
jgi:hypothetical protein